MTSIYEDDISKMSYDKAARVRSDLGYQLQSARDRLIIVKNRRHKILKKLDKEIADIEEQISMLRNTIEEIDKCHFNTLDLEFDGKDVSDISEAEFDEAF